MTTPRLGAPELVPADKLRRKRRSTSKSATSKAALGISSSRIATLRRLPAHRLTATAISSAASPTGAWSGKAKSIAFYMNTAWNFITDEDSESTYDGSAWGAVVSSGNPTETFAIACSDETTAITAGTAKATFRMPYAFTVTAVRASVTTAPTGSTILIDINESGTTILSTKLMIDASEKTSTTAATAAVISDASLADDAEITIDFDQVGSTIAGTGVKVYLIGHR
jgi:hypothetical protein